VRLRSPGINQPHSPGDRAPTGKAAYPAWCGSRNHSRRAPLLRGRLASRGDWWNRDACSTLRDLRSGALRLRTLHDCSSHSSIATSRARASSTTACGATSIFRAPRALRSNVLTAFTSTTPWVSSPLPVSGTANPRTRAKFPPWVIGATSAVPSRLNAAGESTRQGR
jgi:hypothetical protein